VEYYDYSTDEEEGGSSGEGGCGDGEYRCLRGNSGGEKVKGNHLNHLSPYYRLFVDWLLAVTLFTWLNCLWWRGVWDLEMSVIFPENPVYSAFASIGLGALIGAFHEEIMCGDK